MSKTKEEGVLKISQNEWNAMNREQRITVVVDDISNDMNELFSKKLRRQDHSIGMSSVCMAVQVFAYSQGAIGLAWFACAMTTMAVFIGHSLYNKTKYSWMKDCAMDKDTIRQDINDGHVTVDLSDNNDE